MPSITKNSQNFSKNKQLKLKGFFNLTNLTKNENLRNSSIVGGPTPHPLTMKRLTTLKPF